MSARRSWTGRRRREPGHRRSLLTELPVLLLVALVLALLVKTFLLQPFFIPSGSMETTLHGCAGCTGDRIVVTKPPYWFADPEPGDVVVFRSPDTWRSEVPVAEPDGWLSSGVTWVGRSLGLAPPAEDDVVKRVIATGGQTVLCCDDQGRVTVDGQPLDEPYVFEPTPLDSRSFGPVTVPAGRLWVMGDHRSISGDSTVHIGDRYSGTIAVDDVIGKASVIIWPLGRIGWLDSPDIQDTTATAAATAPTGDVAVGLLAVSACLARRRLGARADQLRRAPIHQATAGTEGSQVGQPLSVPSSAQ